jgi:hypothetical protein
MSDDTERRLRDALRAADLPAAPETIHVGLRAIASGAPPRRALARPWLRALPALAAVVALTVIVGAVAIGGRLGSAVSSAEASNGVISAASASADSASAAPSSGSSAPEPSSTAAANGRVYDFAALEAALAADRASFVGRLVLVSGRIGLGTDALCSPDETGQTLCRLGLLDGTPESVSATEYTRALIRGREAMAAFGIMALRVRAAGLEYLGTLGEVGGGTTATVADLRALLGAGPSATLQDVPPTFIVSAWLVASPQVHCPFGGTPPSADTPFVTCPWAWLTPTEEQPTTTGANSMSVTPPADGVHVQWSAYRDFAPNPTSAGLPQPRFGTYVVRLVVDTRQGADGPRGWQVLARLAP